MPKTHRVLRIHPATILKAMTEIEAMGCVGTLQMIAVYVGVNRSYELVQGVLNQNNLSILHENRFTSLSSSVDRMYFNYLVDYNYNDLNSHISIRRSDHDADKERDAC
jgi:hypothetical protein